MEKNIDYYQKYLKYKIKYLELKQEGGGGSNFILIFNGDIDLQTIFGDIYDGNKKTIATESLKTLLNNKPVDDYINIDSPFHFTKNQKKFLEDINNKKYDYISDGYYKGLRLDMTKKDPENSTSNFTYKTLIETTWPYSKSTGVHSLTGSVLSQILDFNSFNKLQNTTRFAFITFNSLSKYNEVFIKNYKDVVGSFIPISSNRSTSRGISSAVATF